MDVTYWFSSNVVSTLSVYYILLETKRINFIVSEAVCEHLLVCNSRRTSLTAAPS